VTTLEKKQEPSIMPPIVNRAKSGASKFVKS